MQLYCILTCIYHSKSIIKWLSQNYSRHLKNHSKNVHVDNVLYNFDVGRLDFKKGRQAENKTKGFIFDTKSQTQEKFKSCTLLSEIRNLNYGHDKTKV